MIAFDVGGVISKYPDACRNLIGALIRGGHDVCVITDQHDHNEVCRTLTANLLLPPLRPEHVYCADYEAYGDACKAVLMRRLGVTVLVDDHPGYTVWPWEEPAPMRLLVQPDVRRSYWAPNWRCEGGEFGRRVYLGEWAGGDT